MKEPAERVGLLRSDRTVEGDDDVGSVLETLTGSRPQSCQFNCQSTGSQRLDPFELHERFSLLKRIELGDLDPKTDRVGLRSRVLRADSRGVEVLSLFLEQGGSKPDFSSGIDAMVREDGDVRTLVAGLVNVSVVLLHAAASAIGASARGFLSGMLNVYSQFGAPDEDVKDEGAGQDHDGPAH